MSAASAPSDDGIILSCLAAMGFLGLINLPEVPDQRYASLLHRIECKDRALHIDGVWFSHVQVTITCERNRISPLQVDGDLDMESLTYNTFDYSR